MRTIKYFVAGLVTVKTFDIRHPKTTSQFTVCVDVKNILDNTPGADIAKTIKQKATAELEKSVNGKIAYSDLVITNISVLDTVTQTEIYPDAEA